jgi:hypothetical protein
VLFHDLVAMPKRCEGDFSPLVGARGGVSVEGGWRVDQWNHVGLLLIIHC